MRILIFIILLSLVWPAWAEQNRYLSDDKIIYENPQESDVLRINASFGFCTVLEFSEKPIMVTVGDNSLLQIEVPKNSKNVVVKPLETRGTTNLFVFTKDRRFNYQVVITDDNMDYVIDTKESEQRSQGTLANVSVDRLIKMARGYPALKEFGDINKRNFLHKDLFYSCKVSGLTVNVIEAFTYTNPHYLILHVVISNVSSNRIELSEKNTAVYIKDHKFTPQYVLFDSQKLDPLAKTDGWLILKDTFISMDNRFTFGIGVNNEEQTCH